MSERFCEFTFDPMGLSRTHKFAIKGSDVISVCQYSGRVVILTSGREYKVRESYPEVMRILSKKDGEG